MSADSRPEAAIYRLLETAIDDTGASSVIRRFILAAWNSGRFGGFDPIDLRVLDRAHRRDVFYVLADIADGDGLDEHRDAIGSIIRKWRPEVIS